jgi:hypothetical protein
MCVGLGECVRVCVGGHPVVHNDCALTSAVSKGLFKPNSTAGPFSRVAAAALSQRITPDVCRIRYGELVATASSQSSPQAARHTDRTATEPANLSGRSGPSRTPSYQSSNVAANSSTMSNMQASDSLGERHHDDELTAAVSTPVKPISELVQGKFELDYFRQYVKPPANLPSLDDASDEDNTDSDSEYCRPVTREDVLKALAVTSPQAAALYARSQAHTDDQNVSMGDDNGDSQFHHNNGGGGSMRIDAAASSKVDDFD